MHKKIRSWSKVGQLFIFIVKHQSREKLGYWRVGENERHFQHIPKCYTVGDFFGYSPAIFQLYREDIFSI